MATSTIGGLDMSLCNIPAAFGSILMDGDEYVRCRHCGYGGCDVRVQCENGCTCHARCLQLSRTGGPLQSCPMCAKPTQGIVLFPMSFREIDETRRTAAALASSKMGGRGGGANNKKRKGGAGSDPTPTAPGSGGAAALAGTAAAAAASAGSVADDLGSLGYISERRTGRWTTEEMAFCDKLMQYFADGLLPVANGIKLNEFLGNMLKSKQSRLTKKMKNAKLSSKVYQRHRGYLVLDEARELSELEDRFFHSVQDQQERAEIKFHMQKEWREQFTQVCAALGQPVDADGWLSSVEEMDRRASQAKDAARMAKRKLMMGVALKTDSQNTEQGVFIERTAAEARAIASGDMASMGDAMEEEMINMLVDEASHNYSPLDLNGKSSLLHSAPFLAKITSYLQRHNVPFEHVDVWVPSYVGEGGDQSICRLCYAGCATAEKLVEGDTKTSRPLTGDESFNFHAFGDYSQKFSFDVGCGLPGRVYESGRPTWEQSVHNAPHTHFERCGGAHQWNIRTVLGIPVASPNVGRIVVTFYSSFDRQKDEELVARLSDECTKLMPSPKWKLVVDIGDVEIAAPVEAASVVANNILHEQQQPPVHNHEQHFSHHQVQSTGAKDLADFSLLASESNAVQAGSSSQVTTSVASAKNDPRVDLIIAMLGEFMPTDPDSPAASYLNGFMSLRLLLLRPTRSLEEEDLIRTILDSFSSYSAGGRARADIAMMLARDYIFLSQQQSPFLSFGQGMLSNSQAPSSGLSVFGLPSTSSSLQNSPALTPIPALGIMDELSIVSN